MQYYSGIDEAGLGPILGPFCATSITFKSNSELKQLLKDQQKKLFYVDDSKKVYSGKYGLKRLEENILAFYALLNGNIPENSTEFIPSLSSIWNREEVISLPVTVTKDHILEKAEKIGSLLKSRGVEIVDIKRTAISPENFNLLLDRWENKSVVCQKIIEPLISSAIKERDVHNLIIDKQGGRKFYKEFLHHITGYEMDIIRELDNISSYKLATLNISFMAKADSESFPVALASMFSKYMREISMMSFNRYWQKKVPGLKETAGYYTDGMRFIDDLKINDLLPENRDSIIRKK